VDDYQRRQVVLSALMKRRKYDLQMQKIAEFKKEHPGASALDAVMAMSAEGSEHHDLFAAEPAAPRYAVQTVNPTEED
jgi:hypothetical protein